MAEFDLETKIKDIIFNARKVAIVPSVSDGADSFAGALGLYRMLTERGKEVTILYPDSVPEDFAVLKEGVKISNSIGDRSLVVSIDYSGTEATKVNYTTENDILYFYLNPVERDFDLSKVKAKITGPDFDLFITLGVQDMADLGVFRTQLEAEMAKSKVFNIDNSSANARFGNLYFVDASMSKLSLLLINKAPKWDLVIGTEAAKALMTGFSC